MYSVTRIELSNICQYSHAVFELSGGLTAVVGRNGIGKTTLLRALMYGLTGMIDGLWGTQPSLQKDGTAVPGYVEVTFTDGTDEYRIRRFSVSSPKFPDSVYRGADQVAVKRRAVDAYMENVFGISCSLMFQLCWCRQGELAQLLTAPPAVLSSFLTQLFETRIFDKLREKLKGAVDTIAYFSPSCRTELDDMEKQLSEASDTAARLAGMTAPLEAAVTEAGKTVEAARDAVKHGMPREQYDAELSAADQEISELSAAIDGCGITLPEDFKPVRQEEADRQVHTLEGDCACAEKRRAFLEVELADCRRDLDILEARRLDRQTAYDRVQEKLRHGGDSMECPVCGTQLDSEHSGKLADHLCRVLTGCASEALYEQQQKQLCAGFEADRKRILEKEAASRKAFEDMGRKLQEELQPALAAARELSARCTLYSAVRNLKKMKASRKKLAVRPVADAGTTEALQEAETILADKKSELDRLVRQKCSAEATCEALTPMIENLRHTVEVSDINNAAREALTAIRDSFAQNRAPARYFREKIQQLNRSLAEYIEIAQLPFTLSLDADRRVFEYTTADGFVHSAAQLSGAQKNMSAVALHMAFISVLSPNMNLSLLDEPAEALDVENKEIMADMFSVMSELLPSVSGTMLIVTRDRTLIESCGNVIDLNTVLD